MKYTDPYESKKFFRSQWNSPFKRFRKTVLPLIVTAVGVFLVMSCFFAFLPWVVSEVESYPVSVFHISFAVLMGIAVAFFGRLLRLRESSRFQTIQIRVKSKNRAPK